MSDIIITVGKKAIDLGFGKDYYIRKAIEQGIVPEGPHAAFGDDVNDTHLSLEGIALVGCPGNAADAIKSLVARRSGWISPGTYSDGFLNLVEWAQEKGAKTILTDIDGVVWDKQVVEHADEVYGLLTSQGPESPAIVFVTGKAIDPKFVSGYGLDRLQDNPVVQNHPWIYFGENGGIHYNARTGETRNFLEACDPETYAKLERARTHVTEEISGYFSRLMDMDITHDPDKQQGRILLFPTEGPNAKRTLVTVNVPRTFHDGVTDYRKSKDAVFYRKEVTKIMKRAAEEVGLNPLVFN